MRRLFAVAIILAVGAAPLWAAEPVGGVTRGFYAGWQDALTMTGGDCKLVVVPAIGGRVMNWSVNGENIIYENREAFGRTLSNTPAGFSPGGAQCDIGPELRYLPRHQGLSIGSWASDTPRQHVIQVTSPIEASVGLQLEKEFTMDPETGELGIVHRMRNMISSETAFCFWDRTVCKNGGFALMPLHKNSRFKARWSERRGESGSYTYDGTHPSDKRARVMDNVLVVQARSLPDAHHLKVGADSDDGWIAYVREKTLFVKYFPVTPKSEYTDGGNTIEFYCDDRIAEVEPLSPEVRLQPGNNFTFPEKWFLTDLPQEVTTFEQARAVVKKIAKSPFK